MTNQPPRFGDGRDPALADSDRMIDAWLRRELSDAYDRTLGEALPDELMQLAMCARPHH